MASKTFYAVGGQSIYDVCLNCYGTLELLYRLIADNNIPDVNQLVSSRQAFVYDDDLVSDLGINQMFAQSGTVYATDVSKLGSTYYTIDGQPQSNNTTPAPVNNNDQVSSTFSQTNSTYFTSGADGTTSMTLQDKDGGSMIGKTIIQIEDEIKPLKPAQFSYNPSTGALSLLGGLSLDLGQTLFILYRETITA